MEFHDIDNTMFLLYNIIVEFHELKGEMKMNGRENRGKTVEPEAESQASSCLGHRPADKLPECLRCQCRRVREGVFSFWIYIVRFLLFAVLLFCPLFRLVIKRIDAGGAVVRWISLYRIIEAALSGTGESEALRRLRILLFPGAVIGGAWLVICVLLMIKIGKLVFGRSMDEVASGCRQTGSPGKNLLAVAGNLLSAAVFLCEIGLFAGCFGYGLSNSPFLHNGWVVSRIWLSPLIWIVFLLVSVAAFLWYYKRKAAQLPADCSCCQ